MSLGIWRVRRPQLPSTSLPLRNRLACSLAPCNCRGNVCVLHRETRGLEEACRQHGSCYARVGAEFLQNTTGRREREIAACNNGTRALSPEYIPLLDLIQHFFLFHHGQLCSRSSCRGGIPELNCSRAVYMYMQPDIQPPIPCQNHIIENPSDDLFDARNASSALVLHEMDEPPFESQKAEYEYTFEVQKREVLWSMCETTPCYSDT